MKNFLTIMIVMAMLFAAPCVQACGGLGYSALGFGYGGGYAQQLNTCVQPLNYAQPLVQSYSLPVQQTLAVTTPVYGYTSPLAVSYGGSYAAIAAQPFYGVQGFSGGYGGYGSGLRLGFNGGYGHGLGFNSGHNRSNIFFGNRNNLAIVGGGYGNRNIAIVGGGHRNNLGGLRLGFRR